MKTNWRRGSWIVFWAALAVAAVLKPDDPPPPPPPAPVTVWDAICDDPETFLAQTFDLLAITVHPEQEGEVFTARCKKTLFRDPTPTLYVWVHLNQPEGGSSRDCIAPGTVVAQVLNDLAPHAPMNRPVAAVVHCDVPRGHRGLATHSAHYDPATNTIGNGVF